MNQSEYNSKVQDMQRMWGEKTRVRPIYVKPLPSRHIEVPKLVAAEFQVFWGSRWHTIGGQSNPFTPETSFWWNDVLEYEMKARFVDALVRS